MRAAGILWLLVLTALPVHSAPIVNASVPTTLSGAGTRDCRVYLPPSYATPQARTRRYPVVVFLHGWPGSEGNWPGQGHAGEMLDRLIAAHTIPEVVGLFPDGSGAGRLGRGIWLDSADGRSRLETFLVHDLLVWADRTYRTLADPTHRAVIGLSDGATGGMNLVMRHPEAYRAVGAHSGDYRLKADWSSAPLFGAEPAASQRRTSESPLANVARDAAALRLARIYFDCGTSDESIEENRELHAALDSLGIAHTYREFPGGHDWGYWRTHLETSLEAVTAGWR